jgi:hypothetical protein
MRRLGRHARESTIALALLACAFVSPASAGNDRLAAAIQTQLARAGNPIFPMVPSDGWFDDDPIKPVSGFYINAALHSVRPFRLTVEVYKTQAQAAAMYRRDVGHVEAIGGGFYAFRLVRVGRVVYMASTASAPDPAAPAVPLKAFQKLVRLAGGP